MYQVVIVEDDPMVAMLNRRYTEKDPRFQVCRECPDGRAALEYLRSHPADLVILDMYMPQMDGMDVLRQLEQLEIVEEVEANAAGVLCERDLQDPNRLNVRIPTDVVNGLHVFAGVIDLLL